MKPNDIPAVIHRPARFARQTRAYLAERTLKMTKLSDLQEALRPACDQDGHPVTQQRYDDLLAENERLREAINAIAEGEIYPVQVALAALAATEPKP